MVISSAKTAYQAQTLVLVSMGDRCTVESGLYVTAGTKVRMLDKEGNEVEIIKARDLAGVSWSSFRRNSISGQIECLANKSAVESNSELHSNN